MDETGKWFLTQGVLGAVCLLLLGGLGLLWRALEAERKAASELQERRVTDAKTYGEKMSAQAEASRETVDRLTEALRKG